MNRSGMRKMVGAAVGRRCCHRDMMEVGEVIWVRVGEGGGLGLGAGAGAGAGVGTGAGVEMGGGAGVKAEAVEDL